MKKRGSSRKVAPGLVALSSAAILTVYTAGFLRTRAVAARFASDGDHRRNAGPAEASPVPLPEPPAPVAAASAPPAVAAAPAIAAVPAAPVSDHATRDSSPAAAKTAAESTLQRDAADPPAPAVASAPPVPVPAADTDPKPDPPSIAAPPQPRYKDGSYTGWGTSRHGDIQATVVIEGGRIASAEISQCLTRYSCSWIAMLPPQVAARQSPEVDYVSGATQSTNAFYYAVVEALSRAK